MIVRAIPQVGAAKHFRPPHFERHVLPNGLQLFLVHKPNLPVFDLQMISSGGALLDPLEKTGRASMAAEVLDEGTANHSALELSAELEQLGAELAVYASWDATFVGMHALTPQFPRLLDLLAEVVLQPTLPPEEFTRKREERLNTLLQERDEPRTVASKSLQRTVFGTQHPFGWPIAGTTATIEALDRSDVADFYGLGFSPRTSCFVLAGDIETADSVRAFTDRFGYWQNPAAPQPSLPPAPDRTRAIYLIDRPEAAQSEVRIGHVGVPREAPDYFPLLVLNTILGGSFKSRLNMRLREEKGFTYGASSAFTFRRLGGFFSGGAAVFTNATAEAVSICVEEIERIRDEDVSAEELDRARNYLSIGFARRFETTSDLVTQLAEIALYGLPDDYLSTYAQRISAVTVEEVRRAAQQHLRPAELSVVVVGKGSEVRKPLSELQLGPVVDWMAE